jgi:DMSO/TMAO reductase YedYZ molybdopterin-dependent catalytic subunit
VSILTRLNTPCFSAGGRPGLNRNNYLLKVTGLAANPREFTWDQLSKLPLSRVDARLTSVSGWSVRAVWEGVLWRDFRAQVEPAAEADHATFKSAGQGYETTISLADLDQPRVLICWAVEGEPLEADYGGPVRMIVPHLYGYKSAKWLTEIEFVTGMRGGYWEDRGYTRSGVIEPGTTLDVNTKQKRPIKGGEVTEF